MATLNERLLEEYVKFQKTNPNSSYSTIIKMMHLAVENGLRGIFLNAAAPLVKQMLEADGLKVVERDTPHGSLWHVHVH
jgi:hypothetical protein